MTTARTPRGSGSTPRDHARSVAGRVVRRALLATLSTTAVLALLAAVLSDSAAVAGVLVGAALVCGFFGLGAVVLIWVTKVSPAASLLVGLMTYTLQVVGLALVFAGLDSSGRLESDIDGRWLGGTVIAGTVVWLAIQVTLSMRARQLYFDPSSEQARSEGSEPASDGRTGGGPEATEAGAR
jgi:ATP synthase protein I